MALCRFEARTPFRMSLVDIANPAKIRQAIAQHQGNIVYMDPEVEHTITFYIPPEHRPPGYAVQLIPTSNDTAVIRYRRTNSKSQQFGGRRTLFVSPHHMAIYDSAVPGQPTQRNIKVVFFQAEDPQKK